MWPHHNPNLWYTCDIAQISPASATTGFATGQAVAFPIQIYRNGTIEAMGLYKTNATSIATSVRLGLFESSGGKPGALVHEFGSISLATASTGVISTAGAGTVESNRVYWLVAKLDTLAVGTHPTIIRGAKGSDSYATPMHPYGYSGVAVQDFPATGGGSWSGYNVGIYYTGLGTGAFGSLASTDPTGLIGSANHIDYLPWFTFSFDPQTQIWDTLSTVATLDHDLIVGQEVNQHHAEIHGLDETVHSGGLYYKTGSGVTITDADFTSPSNGMVALTYDIADGMTRMWVRTGGTWKSVEL
jgi:hypothetical protein